MKKKIRTKLTEAMYMVVRAIAIPILNYKYKPIILNKDVIPKKGAVVFVGNHRHKMDQYFIAMTVKRSIHWATKEEYYYGKDSLFGNPTPLSCFLTKIFIKAVGCIYVDRKGDTSSAKNSFDYHLATGSSIGLFPEGTRNKTKETLLPFKFGAVAAAKKADVQIQASALSFDAEKHRVIVNFRPPFKVGERSLEEANEHLKKEILKGLKENNKLIDKK